MITTIESLINNAAYNNYMCYKTYLKDGQCCYVVVRGRLNHVFAYLVNENGLVYKVADATFHIIKRTGNFRLDVLTVDELKRNQGIGSAIINSIQLYAFDQDCEKVSLVTSKYAKGFYEKNGFEMVPASDMREVSVMVKHLTAESVANKNMEVVSNTKIEELQ